MKQVFVIVGLLVALLVASMLYWYKSKANNETLNPHLAMPKSVGVYVQVPNLYQFLDKTSSLNYGAQINQSSWLQTIAHQKDFMQPLLLLLDSNTQNFKIDKALLGFTNKGNGVLDLISIMDYQGTKTFNFDDLTKLFGDQNAKFSAYNFDGHQIYSVEKWNNHPSFSFIFYKNLFIVSFQTPLVEEALQTLTSQNSSSPFEEISTLSSDIHVYVRHKSIAELLPVLLNKDFITPTKDFFNLAEISHLEVNFFEDHVALNGYTSIPEDTTKLLSKLSNCLPVEKTVHEILPNNTAYYNFVAANDAFFITKDIELSYLYNWVNEQYAYFSLETFDEDFLKRSGLVVKAKDIKLTEQNLETLLGNFEVVDSFQNHALLVFNDAQLLNKAFPSKLLKFENPIFTILDEYVIFADDAFVLKSCIQKYNEGNTLHRNLEYAEYASEIPNKTNYFVYCNPTLWSRPLQKIFKNEVIDFSKLGRFSFYYSNLEKSFFTAAKINYGENNLNKSKLLWETSLDTLANYQPQKVMNHENKSIEIITQDLSNKMYLINSSGEIVFQRKIDGPILSEIYQIDFYKNRKLQYVFNTEKKIYVVDRLGNDVADFPLNLPANATNGMTVVNYDNQKIYRYFIACENDKVYGFEHTGKPLTGWSPVAQAGNISTKIEHIVIDKKDYLSFVTDSGAFYALDRRGEQRFPPVALNHHFAQSFKQVDKKFLNGANGKVFSISTEGTHASIQILDSTYQYFTPIKIDKDLYYSWANSDEVQVLKTQIEPLMSYGAEGIKAVDILQIGAKKYWAVYTNNLVYFLDDRGTLHEDFPKTTNAKILIAKLYESKNEILLLQDKAKLQAIELKFAN